MSDPPCHPCPKVNPVENDFNLRENENKPSAPNGFYAWAAWKHRKREEMG